MLFRSYNDIMFLKRDVVEELTGSGINKFILIGENVLNFHGSDDSYYQEWFDDVGDGWIATINFRSHVMNEMQRFNLDYYFVMGGELEEFNWRILNPVELFSRVENLITKRLN